MITYFCNFIENTTSLRLTIVKRKLFCYLKTPLVFIKIDIFKKINFNYFTTNKKIQNINLLPSNPSWLCCGAALNLALMVNWRLRKLSGTHAGITATHLSLKDPLGSASIIPLPLLLTNSDFSALSRRLNDFVDNPCESAVLSDAPSSSE